MIIWSLILSFSLILVKADWHDNFGPWVVGTRGEPWPMPMYRTKQDGFLILRPSNFEIEIDEDSDILSEAKVRYKQIISDEARIGVASLINRKSGDESVRDHPFFKGMLQRLHVTVTGNIERIPHLYMNESYQLTIAGNIADLNAPSVWGALRGLETFSQLLTPSGEASNLAVTLQIIYDEPLLPHRGLLLDTSRHWLSISDIFVTLDGMSYNKLNVFHWHIVDDNSFPYQSAAFPELSRKGAWHPRMIYTADDVKRIIEYGRLRGIRVMVEFDTPGHTRSWGESHPELLTPCYDETKKPSGKLGPMNPSNQAIWPFLNTLLKEVMDLFTDQYIHLGGDEVPFDCWKSNPDIIAYMQANGMENSFTSLESAYIAQLLEIPTNYNRSSVVWQEVFDNGVQLSKDIVVHVWTGEWEEELSNATRKGHPVLLSACWYLDHVLSGGDWRKFYLCDPLSFDGSENVRNLMLGGEACMWGEFVDRTNIHPRIWPRACATAERLWSSSAESLDDAARRLEEHACRMNRRKVPTQPPNGPNVCFL